MKILLVSWYFPPSNTIGAVRLGGLVRYLRSCGHDLRVVTCKDPPYRQTLHQDIPQEIVSRAKWLDINALPGALAARFKDRAGGQGAGQGETTPASASPPDSSSPPGLGRRIRSFLSLAYLILLNWPDKRIGWLPYALAAGRRTMKDWTPDLIFASGPPFTTLLIGALLARRARTDLVLEFRDRWWDDPYYPPPAWLRAFNRFVERRLVKRATGLTTVSEPWAETYRARYGKPTAVVYNGYDAEILAKVEAAAQPRADSTEARLRIVYTGGIYPGRRDPTPLFEAIGLLGEAGRAIDVAFYGTAPEQVLPLAERAGVRESIILHPEVNHEEAIAAQCTADILLLMQWNDPKEQGNVPGKFFEYIGSRRPILILGLQDGVPASIARERQAGVYGADPRQIAELLTDWLAAKREHGTIAATPETARAGFSRRDQYRKLEQFLEGLCPGPGPGNEA